jgi:hypothetical protein
MRAAAYVVKRIDSPPYELLMAYHIERWGNPWSDGWLDWPAGLLNKMQTVKSYADALSNYKRYSGQKNFVTNNPGIWEMVTTIWAWCKEAGIDWRLFS